MIFPFRLSACFLLAAGFLFESPSCLFCEEQPPFSPVPPFLALVTGDRVNVRAQARASAEILMQLSRGSKVEVHERRGAWCAIRLPSDCSLYVASPYLRVEGRAASVMGRHVQVRSGAGIAFTPVGVLEEGDHLTVVRAGPDWVEIEPPPSCRGWVHEKYLTFLEPLEDF